MMSKFTYSINFLAFNLLISWLVFLASYFTWLPFGYGEITFLLTGVFSVSFFSLLVILPVINKKTDSFVFHFILLTVGQLLFMLSFILFEIYTIKNQMKPLVLSQLFLFVLLLVFQTSLLYRHSRNQD